MARFRFDDAGTLPFRMPDVLPEQVLEMLGTDHIPQFAIVRCYGAVWGITCTHAHAAQLVAVKTLGVIADMPPQIGTDGQYLVTAVGPMPSAELVEICEGLEIAFIESDSLDKTPIPGVVIDVDAETGYYSWIADNVPNTGVGIGDGGTGGDGVAKEYVDQQNAAQNVVIAGKQPTNANLTKIAAAAAPSDLGITVLTATTQAAIRNAIGASPVIAPGTFATPQNVEDRVTALIGGAGAARDTLAEIGAELDANESAVAIVVNGLANKQDRSAILTEYDSFLTSYGSGSGAGRQVVSFNPDGDTGEGRFSGTYLSDLAIRVLASDTPAEVREALEIVPGGSQADIDAAVATRQPLSELLTTIADGPHFLEALPAGEGFVNLMALSEDEIGKFVNFHALSPKAAEILAQKNVEAIKQVLEIVPSLSQTEIEFLVQDAASGKQNVSFVLNSMTDELGIPDPVNPFSIVTYRNDGDTQNVVPIRLSLENFEAFANFVNAGSQAGGGGGGGNPANGEWSIDKTFTSIFELSNQENPPYAGQNVINPLDGQVIHSAVDSALWRYRIAPETQRQVFDENGPVFDGDGNPVMETIPGGSYYEDLQIKGAEIPARAGFVEIEPVAPLGQGEVQLRFSNVRYQDGYRTIDDVVPVNGFLSARDEVYRTTRFRMSMRIQIDGPCELFLRFEPGDGFGNVDYDMYEGVSGKVIVCNTAGIFTFEGPELRFGPGTPFKTFAIFARATEPRNITFATMRIEQKA